MMESTTLPTLLLGGDPADPDERELPAGEAVDLAEQRGRRCEERLAAEPALLGRRRAPETRRAGHRRIGDDDAVDAAGTR